MGGWSLFVSSLSSVSLLQLPSLYTRLTTPTDQDLVLTVEERCCHLENEVLDVLGGRHSYLVLTTASGRSIRLDYFPESQLCFSTEHYFELIPQELFRRAKVRPGLRVADVKQVFQKHTWRDMYSPWSHNCQHVALETYNEITGLKENVLRNDFLVAFMNYLPAYLRRQFRDMDPDEQERREINREFKKEVREASSDKEKLEAIWGHLKVARFNLMSQILRTQPVFDPNDPEGPDTFPDGTLKTATSVLTAYQRELDAWENSKKSGNQGG